VNVISFTNEQNSDELKIHRIIVDDQYRCGNHALPVRIRCCNQNITLEKLRRLSIIPAADDALKARTYSSMPDITHSEAA